MKHEFKVGDRIRWLKHPTRESPMNMDWFPYLQTGVIKEVYRNESIYVVMDKFIPHSPHTEDLHNPDYPFSSVVSVSDIELVEEECKPCCSGDIGENTYKRVISDAEGMNGLYEIPQDMCIGTLGGYPVYQTKINKKTIMSKITTFAKNLVLSADEKLLRKYGLHDECGNHTDEAEELVIAKLVKENEAYLIELAKGMELEEKNK